MSAYDDPTGGLLDNTEDDHEEENGEGKADEKPTLKWNKIPLADDAKKENATVLGGIRRSLLPMRIKRIRHCVNRRNLPLRKLLSSRQRKLVRP